MFPLPVRVAEKTRGDCQRLKSDDMQRLAAELSGARHFRLLGAHELVWRVENSLTGRIRLPALGRDPADALPQSRGRWADYHGGEFRVDLPSLQTMDNAPFSSPR